MVAALVVLSPGTSLPLRMAGRPATFMDRMLSVPEVAAASAPSSSRTAASAALSLCDGFMLGRVPLEQLATTKVRFSRIVTSRHPSVYVQTVHPHDLRFPASPTLAANAKPMPGPVFGQLEKLGSGHDGPKGEVVGQTVHLEARPTVVHMLFLAVFLDQSPRSWFGEPIPARCHPIRPPRPGPVQTPAVVDAAGKPDRGAAALRGARETQAGNSSCL